MPGVGAGQAEAWLLVGSASLLLQEQYYSAAGEYIRSVRRRYSGSWWPGRLVLYYLILTGLDTSYLLLHVIAE